MASSDDACPVTSDVALGPAAGTPVATRGADLSSVVAEAFAREAAQRLPGLSAWLATATAPGAAADPQGLADALEVAHALACGADVAGLPTPAAFLRATEIALSGAERPDRACYELARAHRLVARAVAALALPTAGAPVPRQA